MHSLDSGLPGQEHGDLTQGCRGAAESCHQGQALGTAHAGNTGQQCTCYIRISASEWLDAAINRLYAIDAYMFRVI